MTDPGSAGRAAAGNGDGGARDGEGGSAAATAVLGGPSAAVAEAGDGERCPGRPIALATHGLTKKFGDLVAVDGLEIAVCRGDVYGFLGPNGAGKTTVIRMILGLIEPTDGYLEVHDIRVPQHRTQALRHLGGFVDDPIFYNAMSARRNLKLLGSMSGGTTRERIDEVLETVGLLERGDDRVGGFSHGMKQRLGIAAALLNNPDIVVLDEPTSGLDPGGMKEVRELIRELGRREITVFLSSHLLYEVEQVCTRAAIVNRGHVVAEGPVDELRPDTTAVKLLVGDRQKAIAALRDGPDAPEVSEDGDFLIAALADEKVPDAVRRLVGAGVDVRAVVPAAQLGLEDVFLELTQSDEAERPHQARRKRGLLGRSRA